jgi:LCP family protein required for cell wall assembly
MPGQREHPNSPETPRSPDRLTWALAGVALLLVVGVVVLGIDLAVDSWGDGGAGGLSSEPTLRPAEAAAPPASATPLPTPFTPPPCVAPQDWVVYKVQEGNTLYSLAQEYGTDVQTLKRVNCLESDDIWVDQELHVPGPPAASTAAALATAVSQHMPASDVQANSPDQYTNIVLLGSDKRGEGGTWRTDTMIVVSVDTDRNVVRLLSVPRDLWVNIPGHGFDRINTTDLWGELAEEGGGPELVKQTIKENLGIPVEYYVRVDFGGFVEIIDAIGGVDVDVECPLPDIELTAGMHHMDGAEALAYARSRMSTDDFDRSRRQRKLLMALWQQGLTKDIIPRIPSLWAAMSGKFQTDMPLDRVISLATVGLGFRPDQIFSQSIGPTQVEDWTTPQGAAVLLPRHEELQKLLMSFYGPIDLAYLQRIAQTRLQVLNGRWEDQPHRMALTSLGRTGFRITSSGLADNPHYTRTQVIVHNADEDMARLVAQNLGVSPEDIQFQPDPSSAVDIQVIVGSDYDPCAVK